MEMENCQSTSKEKLEFLDILKEALTVFKKNINFIVFTIFSSLPFFCFLVFFEIVLQRTLLETSKFVAQSFGDSYYYGDWPRPYHDIRRSVWDLSYKLIQLGLLYLVPYYLLELFNMIMTVDMAAKMYGREKPVSLKEMVHSYNKTRFKGPFITSLFVLFLSTCTLGLIWVVTNYYIISRKFEADYYFFHPSSFSFDALIALFHGAACLLLLVKYLEWSAGWNMSLVISILEDTYGIEAFDLSAYYSTGSKERGSLLMLVFFVWGLVLRLPCLYGSCNNESLLGIVFTFVYTSLICLGNSMKWVVCLVYFLDCKKRILETKVDEEVGREAKVSNTSMLFASMKRT